MGYKFSWDPCKPALEKLATFGYEFKCRTVVA